MREDLACSAGILKAGGMCDFFRVGYVGKHARYDLGDFFGQHVPDYEDKGG